MRCVLYVTANGLTKWHIVFDNASIMLMHSFIGAAACIYSSYIAIHADSNCWREHNILCIVFDAAILLIISSWYPMCSPHCYIVSEARLHDSKLLAIYGYTLPSFSLRFPFTLPLSSFGVYFHSFISNLSSRPRLGAYLAFPLSCKGDVYFFFAAACASTCIGYYTSDHQWANWAYFRPQVVTI